MRLSGSDNVGTQQQGDDYSDEYENEAEQYGYASGPDSEYFGPLQPVKSADELKVFKIPLAGWSEKLVQNLEEDPSPVSSASPVAVSTSNEEPTKQVAEASVLSTAFIILLILAVIMCCILPCCYYLIYDPAVSKGLRSFYKGAKKRAKNALDVDIDSPPPYKKFVNETRRASVEKPKERRSHKSKRKSKHGRTIEIPIPSDESVDITITTSDGGYSNDERCHRGQIWSELDIISVGDSFREESEYVTETDCPFEPIHRHDGKHHKKHSTHQSHNREKHQEFQNSWDFKHPLSPEAQKEIFSRYNDAIDYSYKDIPIVHDQRRKSYQPQPNTYNHGDQDPLTIPVPVSNAKERNMLDRLQQSVHHDMEFKKSKKYDEMIREWKWKNSNEALSKSSSLGPPPPPRKNHKNSIDW